MPTNESGMLTREQIEGWREAFNKDRRDSPIPVLRDSAKAIDTLCDMAQSALSRQQGEPDGWAMVPIEPSKLALALIGSMSDGDGYSKTAAAEVYAGLLELGRRTTLALSPAKGEGWQPIETAPKDMRILAFVPWYDTPQCEAGEFKGADFYPSTRHYPSVMPTHWHPLPPAPKA